MDLDCSSGFVDATIPDSEALQEISINNSSPTPRVVLMDRSNAKFNQRSTQHAKANRKPIATPPRKLIDTTNASTPKNNTTGTTTTACRSLFCPDSNSMQPTPTSMYNHLILQQQQPQPQLNPPVPTTTLSSSSSLHQLQQQQQQRSIEKLQNMLHAERELRKKVEADNAALSQRYQTVIHEKIALASRLDVSKSLIKTLKQRLEAKDGSKDTIVQEANRRAEERSSYQSLIANEATNIIEHLVSLNNMSNSVAPADVYMRMFERFVMQHQDLRSSLSDVHEEISILRDSNAVLQQQLMDLSKQECESVRKLTQERHRSERLQQYVAALEVFITRLRPGVDLDNVVGCGNNNTASCLFGGSGMSDSVMMSPPPIPAPSQLEDDNTEN